MPPPPTPPPPSLQNSDEGRAYLDLARRVDEAITFMMACGLEPNSAIMRETNFFVR